jgi:hypothetical protein
MALQPSKAGALQSAQVQNASGDGYSERERAILEAAQAMKAEPHRGLGKDELASRAGLSLETVRRILKQNTKLNGEVDGLLGKAKHDKKPGGELPGEVHQRVEAVLGAPTRAFFDWMKKNSSLKYLPPRERVSLVTFMERKFVQIGDLLAQTKAGDEVRRLVLQPAVLLLGRELEASARSVAESVCAPLSARLSELRKIVEAPPDQAEAAKT